MNRKCFIIFLNIFLYYQGFSQNFYQSNTIQNIEIGFDQPNWDYQLDTLKLGTDNYLMAKNLKINGIIFDSVGVKYKGNSSYDSAYKKNSLHIELNNLKDQSYQGFTDIKLGNSYADPSMIREVLAYSILTNYMDCPQANFAEVYINGIYMGVYSNIESINKDFCGQRFYSSTNTFIKCNPKLTPGPTVKSNLKFISADSNAYKPYYEKKSKNGWKDFVKLCDTLSNFPNYASTILDMDRAIWMLAFNNLLINLDSYNGAFAQNYYLYKDNTNRFNPIIWDLNMAFGGFPFAGSPANGMGSLSIANMQQLSPTYHDTHTDWPLINVVMQNPTYKRMYLAHIRTLIKDYFSANQYVNLAITLQNKIENKVQSDSGRFFSFSQFKNAMNTNVTIGSYAVPGISTLMDTRVSYLKNTADFKQMAPSISSITTYPAAPRYKAAVSITALVTNTNSSTVFLGYKFERGKKFEQQPMFDDGMHGDGNAGDNIFGTNLSMNAATIQYYIYAENNNAGIFSPERAEHEFYQLNVLNDTIKKGDLVINEFLANNDKSNLNEFGNYSDWIELYNNTNNALNIGGCYLSDDMGNLKKYKLDSNTTMVPNSYLLIWADDYMSTAKFAHCGFKLSSTGGKLILSKPNDSIIDSVSYNTQSKNISLGRCPDGTGSFTAIATPTFNKSNNFSCINDITKLNSLKYKISVYPNPAIDLVTFSSNNFNFYKVELYNLLGKMVLQAKFENKKCVLNLENLNSGFYFYSVKDIDGSGVESNKILIIK